MKAAVAVGSSFDCDKAMDHMANHYLGFYDFILGFNLRVTSAPQIKQIDAMNAKTHPERVVGDEAISKVNTLT